MANNSKTIEFSLDWFFTDTEPQEAVYDIAARDRIAAVLGGFNSTVIAYGQTGSGKTHTMMGPDDCITDFQNSDPALHGIVPRASEHIFEGVRHAAAESSFIIQVSYLEVYNNSLNDLIGGKQNLAMREKPNSGLVVDGLTYETVTSSKQVMAALAQGNTKRVVAAMKMNARSSRGHAIFTIYVKEILATGGEKAGKLNLVDLAGMESSKKSYAMEGASNNEMRKVEAKNINVSLYALGSVIERLSEAGRKGGKDAHVPYRDSKLTRLLQDSLGGNSKSTIIVALRVESQNIEESINTLRFAQRAKAIKTKVKDNTVTQHDTVKLLKHNDALQMEVDTAKLMIRQLQQELASKSAEEDDRLAKAREEAASHAADATDASGSAQIAALLEEVAIIKKKYTSILHKSILHRVIQEQSKKAITALRDEQTEGALKLEESEAIIHHKEVENRELAARVTELEGLLASGGGAAAGFGGGGSGGGAGGAGEKQPIPEMITDAEKELKLAMASGDPDRLKTAIANASSTVAKARARGSHVLTKAQVLHGDGKTDEAPEHHKVTNADAADDEEKAYIRFHEIATDRKLALASRGFEVQNIFLDDLYDIALKEGVPQAEWGEFMRMQLPSPRMDDEDDQDADAPAEDGAAHTVDYEVIGQDGVATVKKVKKAMAKMSRLGKLFGWRASMKNITCTYRATADEHFGMDQPDPDPLSGVTDVSDPPAAYGGASLHADVIAHGHNAASAQIDLISMANAEPNGIDVDALSVREGETRAQRYSRALRERMDARDATRKDSHRAAA